MTDQGGYPLSHRQLLIAVYLLLACCGVLPSTVHALGQPYFESVVGTADISNGIITVMAQDRSGLIWMGTPEGLYSFDGQRLRAFRNQPDDPSSLGDDYIRALLPHSDGRLWVATQGAGLSVYDPRSDSFEQFRPQPGDPDSLPSLAALSLAEAPDGDVWVGFGNNGLARWDSGDRRFHVTDNASSGADVLHDATVRCLLFDRVGNLWVGTGNGLQFHRAGSARFERVASQPEVTGSLDRNYVYALFQASDGRIWIGTQMQGAAVLDPASGQLTHFQSESNRTSHPWVSGFAEPIPGRIWVHTYGGGIDVVDAASNLIVERIRSDLSVPGGLTLDRLTAPIQDRSGLVWIGTWGAGVQRHNPNNAAAFRTIRHSAALSNGLSTGSVMSTLPIDADRVWIGTGGNGIDILDLTAGVVDGHRPHPTRPGALRDGTIRALVRGPDDSIWVGTQQAGLQRFLPVTGQFSEPLTQLPRGPIRQLLVTHAGKLVVGMQSNVVVLDPADGSTRTMRLAADRPFTDAAWSLAEDSADRLWIGTPNALLLWAADAEYPVTVESSAFPLRAIADLHVDASGQLWLSGPRGIARLIGWADGKPQFQDYGRQLSMLPQGAGQQLLPDHDGHIWSPRALIDPRNHQIEPIGIADGVDIGSVEIGSGSVSPSGLLYFGGTRGLLIIDPREFRPWRFAAPLVATSIDVDGRAVAAGSTAQGLRLQPGQRRLTIEFAALDYSAPASIRYAYRLTGLDDDWIETDATQRLASYHNLWPGNYRLEVRARSAGGTWGTAMLMLPITVIAAWWQTPLAALLGLLAIIALAYGGVRWRTLAMRERAQALEALVERRTHELSLAKDSAEGALVELKGAQRQLVAAEKMASLGQLVAGVAHEINTPVGIAITASSHLQELAREGSAKLAANRLSREDLARWKQEVAEAARLILSSLERAGALIASFKQVSVDQSSGQRRKFLLHDFLREVQTALTPTLRRTPHTLSLECDEPIELDSYPGALFQILTNLINNALLHAFEEGQTGSLHIHATAEGQQVRIRFRDDGRGMPADVAARAFDPFFTTRRGSGGSGLGLHVVHNLVTQLLGGTIELTTAPGRGTEFTLRFARNTPDSTRASA